MATADHVETLFVGLMSGTSLDGVDGVLAKFTTGDRAEAAGSITTVASAYVPFDEDLRRALMALQSSGADEIQREALVAIQLAHRYAQCVEQLRQQSGGVAIVAIGVHGQTIRHRPDLGYTRQTNHPSLLAELTGIDVIADFRSRDVAAGGQGAPLVPAFHQAVFGAQNETRVVVNIGGISNISILPSSQDQAKGAQTLGFDTGPGNALMDAWVAYHQNKPYDENGAWAASGQVNYALLAALSNEAFFLQPAPKSTGRDLFNPQWLAQKLLPFGDVSPVDVQATLTALTAGSIAMAIADAAPYVAEVYVCGGGAYNTTLMQCLAQTLGSALKAIPNAPGVQSTALLGVAPNQVEALAFAWLAQRFTLRLPGNVPAVTGAAGPRILGALYPA
jgi:anhydro-N-acetylmuramic acid kinase